MKKLLFSLLFLGSAISIVRAQSYTYREYSPANYQSYNYRSGNTGVQVNYGYRYLPRDLRNRLARIEHRLAEEKRCAYRDGRISRREARRISRLQQEIDALLFNYRRNSYRNSRNRNYCR